LRVVLLPNPIPYGGNQISGGCFLPLLGDTTDFVCNFLRSPRAVQTLLLVLFLLSSPGNPRPPLRHLFFSSRGLLPIPFEPPAKLEFPWCYCHFLVFNFFPNVCLFRFPQVFFSPCIPWGFCSPWSPLSSSRRIGYGIAPHGDLHLASSIFQVFLNFHVPRRISPTASAQVTTSMTPCFVPILVTGFDFSPPFLVCRRDCFLILFFLLIFSSASFRVFPITIISF